MFFDSKFRNFDVCLQMLTTWLQMQNWKPHTNLANERYEFLKNKSNKELHIPMQIALKQ